MKIKYCQLCEPIPQAIDEDSVVAGGYMLRNGKKIHLCEGCLSTQAKYGNTYLYSQEYKPEFCEHDKSCFEKKNLVTLEDENGFFYDIMKCEICGFEVRRYGLEL